MSDVEPRPGGPADLVELAGAVSDRKDVDWESVGQLGAGVAGLRTLARLAAAFEAEDQVDAEHRLATQPMFRWGHLDVLEPLGAGRFGEVYRARDRQLGRDVALKLAREGAAEPPRKALEEARRLARVRHPNVLTVYGAAVHDGRVGLWTDLLGGRTLEDRLARDGTFGEGELRLVAIELCQALSAVHGAGVVHGDIKTSNVVRDRDGRLVLVDFGASRLLSVTAPAVVQATPSYLAPEVARGEASPSPTSDLYALGAMLYRLASCAHWRADDAPSLRDARPDLSLGLVRAIESLLAARPEERPASAGEAERLLAGAAEQGGRRSGWGWSGWTAASALLAASIVLLALVAVATGWIDRGAETDTVSDAVSDAGADAGANVSTEPAVLLAERGGETFVVARGASLRPGDLLRLELELARESHVYVFNEDDAGALFVLFPLPGVEPTNPLPEGVHHLPGSVDGRAQSWEVTSAGGRERFLVVGSATALPELESWREGQDVASPVRRVREAAGERGETLRGVGGLVTTPEAMGDSRLLALRAQLEEHAERDLIWTQFLEVENPRR